MRQRSDFNSGQKPSFGLVFPAMFRFVAPALIFCAIAGVGYAQGPTQSLRLIAQSPGTQAEQQEPTTAISRSVKEVFEKCAKAVVKIRGTDEHSDLVGTGFFIDRLERSTPRFRLPVKLTA